MAVGAVRPMNNNTVPAIAVKKEEAKRINLDDDIDSLMGGGLTSSKAPV